MRNVLQALPLIALTFLARCSTTADDDGSENTVNGGTSSAGNNAAGSGEPAGSGGVGGSGGDAGSGGTSSGGSGGVCESGLGDGACNQCLNGACCGVTTACGADADCAACAACLDQEIDLGMCLIMATPVCNSMEMPTYDLLGCALESCVAECGLD